jgi:hypothetical protein
MPWRSRPRSFAAWAEALALDRSTVVSTRAATMALFTSVAPDHDVRRLDDRIGVIADRETKLLYRFIRDRRGDHRAARQLDPHMRRGRPLLHLDESL